jgi:predicted transglutaminase-like cysteine proteinase
MTIKKKVAVATLATVALAGVAFAGSTMAHNGNGTTGQAHTPPTAAERTAKQAEMKTKLTENLTRSVTSGKLTEAQKAHILDVENQIHTKMEAGDRTGADKLRDELRAWMTAEKIDSSIMPGRFNGHGPKDGKGPRGPRPTVK